MRRVDRAGLDVEVKRRTDQAPRDFVFEQSPNPGQHVDKGSLVTLFVSNGPSTVRVPDVVGLDQADARRRLRRAQLRPEVERESSTKVADGHRDPHGSRSRPAGRARFRGDARRQQRSPSRSPCRTWSGRRRRTLFRALREAGLSPAARERPSSEPVDTVIEQTPCGRAEGRRGIDGHPVRVERPGPRGAGRDRAAADRGRGASWTTPASASNVRTRQTDQPDEDGIVLSQSPKGGVERREGATVTITVGELAAARRPRRHAVRVVVLGGGRSSEHPVSLMSAASVLDGLERAGHETVSVVIGRDGMWREDERARSRSAITPGAGLLGGGRRVPGPARPVRRGRDGAGPAGDGRRALRRRRRAGFGGLHGQGRVQGIDGQRGHAAGALRGGHRAGLEQPP